jgi:nitrate reductase NapD
MSVSAIGTRAKRGARYREKPGASGDQFFLLRRGAPLMRIKYARSPEVLNSHDAIVFIRAAVVNITGILVSAQPECRESVRLALVTMPGVEVHAVTPEGRMVVTVEKDSDGEMTAAFDLINRLPGVLSAALVYHHDEDLVEDDPISH